MGAFRLRVITRLYYHFGCWIFFLTGGLWDLGGLVKFNGRGVAGVEFIE